MSELKKLGEYIEVLNRRNSDMKLGIDSVRGISNTKQITDTSKATVDESVISKFYVINPGEFIYNPRTTRMGDKVGLAFNNTDKPLLFTFNNSAFKIKDSMKDKLLPEYLYLFFCRSEFDRFARINSWGSATELFLFDDLCTIKFNPPDIKEQQKIVDTYNAITNRIQIKQKINENLEKTANVIFKYYFTNTVEYDEKTLDSLVTRIDNRGKTPPNTSEETPYPVIEIGSMKTKGRIISFENVEKYITKEYYETGFRAGNPKEKDILMSTVGSLADLKLFWGNKGSIAQNIIGFRCKDINLATYIYQYMIANKHELMAYEIGSVQASIKVTHVIEYKIKIPNDSKLIASFDKKASAITENIYKNIIEIAELEKLRKSVISQISKR